MKRILIFSFITFFLYAGMRAQSVGIDEVLHRIEANNKELQAKCATHHFTEIGEQVGEQFA